MMEKIMGTTMVFSGYIGFGVQGLRVLGFRGVARAFSGGLWKLAYEWLKRPFWGCGGCRV